MWRFTKSNGITERFHTNLVAGVAFVMLVAAALYATFGMCARPTAWLTH